jgi:hypothetical protein
VSHWRLAKVSQGGISRMTPGKGICVGTTILLFFVLTTRNQALAQECPVKQSPRNIQAEPFPGPYNGTPTHRPDSVVTNIDAAATITYEGKVLTRCDQHYHVPVENTQGCPHEKVGEVKIPEREPLPEGQWVEVHTVYALEVEPGCDGLDHNLRCCIKEPFVVRGFSARVKNTVGSKSGGPLIPADGRPLAEWSGSNTGAPCEGCKPIAAQWSSLVNCEITVTQQQLEPLGHAHEARCVQPPKELSKDLTLVIDGEPPFAPCRLEKAPVIIKTNEEARSVCPRTCGSAAQWNERWITWNNASECGCCAARKR